jgi:hypothetical protein
MGNVVSFPSHSFSSIVGENREARAARRSLRNFGRHCRPSAPPSRVIKDESSVSNRSFHGLTRKSAHCRVVSGFAVPVKPELAARLQLC